MLRVQRNVLRKKHFCLKNFIFSIFFGHWEKDSARLSKLHATCPEERFEKKTLLFEKFYFFNFFWTFGKKFPLGLSHLLFTCPEEDFEKSYNFRKENIIFNLFSDFWRKFFGRVVKTGFYVSGSTF